MSSGHFVSGALFAMTWGLFIIAGGAPYLFLAIFATICSLSVLLNSRR